MTAVKIPIKKLKNLLSDKFVRGGGVGKRGLKANHSGKHSSIIRQPFPGVGDFNSHHGQ